MNKLKIICEYFGLDFGPHVGWGNKRSGLKAQNYSASSNLQTLIIEDGFISHIEKKSIPNLSIACDVGGIYYESLGSSVLFNYISELIQIEDKKQIIILMEKYRTSAVSKYNALRESTYIFNDSYVLLVDQVYGDLSVEYGMASEDSFSQMLDSALIDYPDHLIVVKIHPDVLTGKKKGYLNIDELSSNPRIKIIAENCHPVRLIREADAVYTVTSQVGFEALIWGKKVKCFGMPFYAGWGLTEDLLPAPDRRSPVSLEQLVYAALVKYPKYIDLETTEPSSVERTIEYVGFQRRMRFRFPETIYAYGFSLWKKPILKKFSQGSEVIFIQKLSKVPKEATLMIWGSKEIEDLNESIKIVRIEDGFLRSVGLGADFIHPLSWVFDEQGVYYDYHKPSRLEKILEEKDFKVEELDRAEALRESIVDQKISKYNLGHLDWQRPEGVQSVLLVIGQVEQDASIRFGTDSVNTNLKLLQMVREAYPDSYILYKPHPDVVAGIRRRGPTEEAMSQYYDGMIEQGDSVALFDQVDSIHTMTSLVGFEALLRGKSVYCYGLPFYAGWGLTQDLIATPRRKKRLSLGALVAGALIDYPTYISQTSGAYTSPERAIVELAQLKKSGVKTLPFWRKILRDLIKLWNHSSFRSNP